MDRAPYRVVGLASMSEDEDGVHDKSLGLGEPE